MARDEYWQRDRPQVIGQPPPPGPPLGDPSRRRALVGLAIVVVLAVAGALMLPSTGDRTRTTEPGAGDPERPAPDAAVPDVQIGTAVVGAGWEEIDAGPVAGRIGPTAAWTGDRLFVWGGFEPGPSTPMPGHRWRHDGALYDPVTGFWDPVPPLPDQVCPPRGPAVAYAAGDVVVLRLRTHWRADCVPAAAFRPHDGSWEPLHAEFFRRVTWLKPLVWTGELFVAPRDGLAYHWERGEILPLPDMPRGWEDGRGVKHALWTGDRVLAVGSTGVFEWIPGEQEWHHIGPPVVVEPRSAAVWVGDVLVVVDYRVGAETFDGESWSGEPGLPLVRHWCPVAAAVVGDVPVVRLCSGLALWDRSADTWVPIPLDDVTTPEPFGVTLVAGDDAVYAIGHAIRRFRIERSPDGSLVAPSSMPIGSYQLDLPEGFVFAGSEASVRGPVEWAPHGVPHRSIPDGQATAITVAVDPEVACSVTSTITATGASRMPMLQGFRFVGSVAVPPLHGRVWRTDDARLAFSFDRLDPGPLLSRFGDTADESLLISCSGPPDRLFDAAFALASGLWRPGE